MRCAHAHSYDLYCAQGLLQGSSLKRRGKSVKEELNVRPNATHFYISYKGQGYLKIQGQNQGKIRNIFETWFYFVMSVSDIELLHLQCAKVAVSCKSRRQNDDVAFFRTVCHNFVPMSYLLSHRHARRRHRLGNVRTPPTAAGPTIGGLFVASVERINMPS